MKPEQEHKGHPHAELMKLYAEDAMESERPWENWELKEKERREAWIPCQGSPTWSRYLQYRRKPRFIEINGHQVPEPVRKEPQVSSLYYYPAPSIPVLHCCTAWVEDDTDDLHRLSSGLAHLTREAAIAHAKALLSFTAKEVAK